MCRVSSDVNVPDCRVRFGDVTVSASQQIFGNTELSLPHCHTRIVIISLSAISCHTRCIMERRQSPIRVWEWYSGVLVVPIFTTDCIKLKGLPCIPEVHSPLFPICGDNGCVQQDRSGIRHFVLWILFQWCDLCCAKTPHNTGHTVRWFEMFVPTINNQFTLIFAVPMGPVAVCVAMPYMAP